MLLLLLLLQAGTASFPQGFTLPTLIRRVEPEYTEEARAARVQGMVVLETVVSEDGTAKVSRVVRSLGYGLDASATRAIERWRFQPATKDGTPVKTTLDIEVSFNLSG